MGREFKVGTSQLRGVRLCEPCAHLAGMLAREMLPAMVAKAGLRAEMIFGDEVRVGDQIIIEAL